MEIIFSHEKTEKQVSEYVRIFTLIEHTSQDSREQLKRHLEVRVYSSYRGISLITKNDLLVDVDKKIEVKKSTQEYKEIVNHYKEYMKGIC